VSGLGVTQVSRRPQERWSVRSAVARVALVSVLCGAAVVAEVAPAGAKALPVVSVMVTTKSPTVGKPIVVLMRFAAHQDLGDFAWENAEVATIPLDRADATGWPLRSDDIGTVVKLHRVGFGEYQGSFTVRRGGWYVVFDRSSRIVHADGLVVNGLSPAAYAPPVKVFVAGSPSDRTIAATHRRKATGAGSLWWLLGAVLFGLVVICAAMVVGRRRSRRVAQSSLGADHSYLRTGRSGDSEPLRARV
jgi:hypothetical protein